MSVDVSTLAIKVESSGIKEASDALGSKGLTRSAENADKAVTSLTGNLGALFRAGGNVTGVFSGLTGTMALINNAMQSAADNATAMARALASITNNLGDLTTATNESGRAIQRTNGHGGVFVTTLKAMASAALAYTSIGTARHLVEQSDAWNMMTARLKIVTGSTEDAKAAQQDLFDIAQRIRVPLADMASLYTRMVPPLQSIGKGSEDAKKMIEAVSLALKLNGSTAAESASVMLQFSQALQKGKLDGQEFNAVASNGPLIMRAIAEATGKTQAELATLRSKGFITVDVLVKALEDALPKWQKLMGDMPMTVDDAWTRIKNIWMKSVGEIGGNNELGKKITESMQKLEEYIPTVVETLVKGITFLIDNAKELGTVLGALAGIGLVKWAAEAALAFISISKEIKTVRTEMSLLNIVMGLAGGPVGIVTGLLAAGVTAWMLWKDSGKDASKAVTAQTEIDVNARIVQIEKENVKLRERNKLMADGKEKPTAVDAPSDVALTKVLSDLQKYNNEFADPKTTDARKTWLAYEIGMAQTALDRLQTARAENLELQKKGKELEKIAAIKEETKKWQKKVGTTAQKTKIEEDEADDEWMTKTGEKAPAWVHKGILESKTHADRKASSVMEDQVKAAQNAAAAVKKLGDEADLEAKKIEGSTNSTVKLSAAEIELFNLQKLRDSITSNKKAQSPEALKLIDEAMAADQAVIAKERNNAVTLEAKKAAETNTKAQNAQIDTAQKELDTVNAKIASYGELKGSADDAALSEAKLAMAQFGDQSPDEWVKRQMTIIDILQEVHDKKLAVARTDNSAAIDKWFDESKVADFGNGFTSAFGKAGKAIDNAGKSLDQFKKKMAANAVEAAKIKKEAEDPKGDALKASYDAERLRKKELNDTLDMYADMAGAVKGFFNEKTTAYKVFDTLEKGLRIARMAQDAEEFATKIAQGWAWVAAKVSQAWTAMATDDTMTANSKANSAASGEASLAAGIAKCFEQLGIWGFVGAAAIIAFMAAWGFGGHGGGSAPSIKEDRQKANGTGTVLGDEAAKTESLSKSLDALASKYNMGLEYSSRMLSYLRSINDGISSLASGVVSLNGVRGTTADQFAAGVGSSKKALGFGSSSTEMTDSGLQFDPNQTVGGVMANGANVQGYYDLHKQSSSWWGLSKSSSNEHVNTQVDSAFKQQVSATVTDMAHMTMVAAQGLGKADQGLANTISNLKLGIDMVSLNGLSGDDLTNALNSAFSKLGDQMATAVMDPKLLKDFQKVGEGSLQTLVRLSSGLENATMLMGNLGIQVASFNDIADKHGDVDAELVRASIDAKEAGTNISQFVSEMSGSAEDIVAAYKSLVDIRSTLKAMGSATDVSRALINGAGGLDALSSGLGDFISNFYDDGKKAAIGLSKVRDQFTALGVVMPSTKDGFKSLVESLLAGDDASQTMAGRLMGLSGAFSDAMDAMDSAVASKKDALKTAYDNESSALQDTIDKMNTFVKSMQDFKQSLMLGDLSTGNALDKYATAKSAYEDTYSKAMAGDQDALDKFQDVASTFLQASRTVNASGEGYTSDYKTVLDAIDQVQAAAQGKGDVATQQLDAVKTQVGALIDLTDKVTTVTQAILDLNAALTGQSTPTTAAVTQAVAVPTQIGPLSGNAIDGQDSIDTMLNAANAAFQGTQTATTTSPNAAATTSPTASIGGTLQQLVVEIMKLRAEQAQQTGDVIAATYDSNEQNAQTVVAGTTKAAQDAAYVQTVQTGLN